MERDGVWYSASIILTLGCPIVPVVKQDGSIRVCVEYKVTTNLVAKPDSYPISKLEDLFTPLSNEKSFSNVDLASSFQQIVLDEESREYTNINTHKGLYQYTRLPLEWHRLLLYSEGH